MNTEITNNCNMANIHAIAKKLAGGFGYYQVLQFKYPDVILVSAWWSLALRRIISTLRLSLIERN